jgi:hypothetical protein
LHHRHDKSAGRRKSAYTTLASAFAGVAMLINVYAGVLVWVPHIAAHPNALAN